MPRCSAQGIALTLSESSLFKELERPELRAQLVNGLRGIEREALRVTPEGRIAQTPHPPALGAALTHPLITTDYSEALLELVTKPAVSVSAAWNQLEQLHQFVYASLSDDLLWATSMPCVVQGDSEIPIADYGTSNVGRMKHIYRLGLAYRYGRAMQVIAGVHFNYSVPVGLWPLLQAAEKDGRPLREYIDARYFDLLRNFQRVGWLLLYLYGSSPAVCKSFFGGRPQSLSEFDDLTVYGRHATSLRMSDIGYHNTSQANLNISYNSLDEYVEGLQYAIETPYPPYERVGVRQNGEYCQLSTSILQIANEYYSPARPKQIAESGEKPTLALQRRGVAYLEVRALDVDPFSPVGISPATMRFVEVLLLGCLIAPSPPGTSEERKANQFNHSRAACCGRTPGIKLQDQGKERMLTEWAEEICEGLLPVAALLDSAGEGGYEDSVHDALSRVRDSAVTPSARVLSIMREQQESFFSFALRVSREYHEAYQLRELDSAQRQRFAEMAQTSLAEQGRIEAADQVSFEDYLQTYYSQS